MILGVLIGVFVGFVVAIFMVALMFITKQSDKHISDFMKKRKVGDV